MEGSNTAGEAMDDLLRPGGPSNLDDGFQTLEEDGEGDTMSMRAVSPEIDPALLAEDRERANKQVTTSGRTAASDQEASDGDVEDNTSGVDDAQDAIRTVRQKGSKTGTNASAPNITSKTFEPTAAPGKNRFEKSAAPPTSRYSTRNREKVDQANTTRPVTRTPVKTRVAELKANNKKLMTARAATVHKKAKKKGVVSKGMEGRGATTVRLRNWRGEAIKEAHGFVLVWSDEEDREQYVCY